MGLFDYFSKEASTQRKLDRCTKRLTNMYYQSADRMGAAQEAAELAQAGEVEGIAALLSRFEHLNQSSTTDREEKEYILQLLVGLGETAVEPVTSYIRRTDKAVYWPLRFLQTHWDRERYVEFVAELLESFKPDYIRDPSKKLGIVQLAAELHTPRIAAAIRPLVGDHDETVRFHAIDAMIRFEDEQLETLLVERFLDDEEDSGRILRQIAEQMARHGWSVAGRMDAVQAKLPGGFLLLKEGVVRKV